VAVRATCCRITPFSESPVTSATTFGRTLPSALKHPDNRLLVALLRRCGCAAAMARLAADENLVYLHGACKRL
jgi:hypothetical protein